MPTPKLKPRWNNLFSKPQFTNSLKRLVAMDACFQSMGFIWFNEESHPMRKLPIDCGNPIMCLLKDGNLILIQPCRLWSGRLFQLGVNYCNVTHWSFLPHPLSGYLPTRIEVSNSYNYQVSKDLLDYVTSPDYAFIEPSIQSYV